MMTIVKNMKIRNKLFVGFSVLLIATITISIYGGIMIMSVDSGYSHALEYPTERVEILNGLAVGLMDARRTMNRAAMYIHDPNDPAAGIMTQWENVINIRTEMNELFDRFFANLYADPMFTDEERADRIRLFDVYEREVIRYFDHYITGLIVYARMFDEAAAIQIVHDGVATVERANSYHNQLLTAAQDFKADLGDVLSQRTITTVWTLVAVAVAGVVLSFIIIVAISSAITKPIRKVVTALSDVSIGNLDVNIDRANITKDETGVLTQDVCSLIDVIRAIVEDLTKAYNEYMGVGNIQYTIENPIYQNSFEEAIGLVNKLISQNTTDIMSMSDVLSKVSEGDFSVNLQIEDWPGDWAVLPQSMNGLTDNLKAVSNEISEMIDAAANKGDLNFKIDADRYNGDWQRIMAGLNDIATAVDKPLKTIALAMDEMRAGNYDLADIDRRIRENGHDANAENYRGVFYDIVSGFDSTISVISSYIHDITEDLAAISSGNLTTNITKEFVGDFAAIKDSLNNISVTLSKTMSEITSASEQVLSGAKQISISAQELANGAQEQASSVEELNATIDTINHQTQQNAESASTANELSQISTTNAKEGNESMQEMLLAMEQINESSNDISKIIKVIDGISFQTNLLALNAAVEAARAGEHGKGFSVVAEEVRSLAGRSQESASETTGLIETSINRVESGSKIAESTSQSLDMIVKNASEVSELISNISISSREQAEAISQVTEGLAQISQVTQSNSAVSEETAAASQELNSQAELLKELVAYFKV